jgi:hypothetical protein
MMYKTDLITVLTHLVYQLLEEGTAFFRVEVSGVRMLQGCFSDSREGEEIEPCPGQ